MSALGGTKPDVDMASFPGLKDKDQVVAALAASFAFVHKAIGTMTVENAFQSLGGPMTRATMAGGNVVVGTGCIPRADGRPHPAARKRTTDRVRVVAGLAVRRTGLAFVVNRGSTHYGSTRSPVVTPNLGRSWIQSSYR